MAFMTPRVIQQPAFGIIQAAERVMAQAPPDDLVVVFTYSDRAGGLLVYNSEQLPALPADMAEAGWRMEALRRLGPDDYTPFDGPVISVGVIDVLLDDVPTHGANFYPMEELPLFRQAEGERIFARTANKLIGAIAARWLRLSPEEQAAQRPSFCKRVIQLYLPDALERFEAPDLVALRFNLAGAGCLAGPAGGAGRVTVGTVSMRPVFDRPGQADDILSLADLGADEWVAGLRELRFFVPSLNEHAERLLPLRPAFRRFVNSRFLADTCRRLALRLWQENRADARQDCYNLAAEAWLEGRDATDLVAIVPDKEFLKFAGEGQAVAVTRGPVAAALQGDRRCSLEDVWRGRLDIAGQPVFALPALEPFFRRLGAAVAFDLGPVLRQAERYTDLARTLWLLSRDLLNPPTDEWRQIGASMDDITDMAQRAVLMYGLANPWEWRQGRYSLLVSECYRHLDRCLQQRERDFQGRPQEYYYTALRAWYDCAATDDVIGNMMRVVEYSGLFLTTVEEAAPDEALGGKARAARQLREFGSNVLHPEMAGPSSTNQAAKSVGQVLHEVVRGETAVPLLSPMGDYLLGGYLDSYRRWHRVKSQSSEQRPDAAALNDLQSVITKWRRRAFAPGHELQVLLGALADVSEQIRSLQLAVDEGPNVRLLARTGEISLGARQALVVEVQNIGRQPAREFRLAMERFSGFDLLAGLPPDEPADLEPGERRRVELQVRALDPQLVLVFSYRFRDPSGRLQVGEQRLTLQARQEARGLRSRVNPFEVGRPVYGLEQFFGRENEVSMILTRLAKGDTHPLVLRGPRRIGKSSLLRHVGLLINERVEVGDTGLSSDLQAAVHNHHAILVNLQAMDRTLPRPFVSFLSSLLGDICDKLSLDGAPLIQAFEQAAGRDGSPRAFRKQMTHILLARPEARLVILLDELDEVFGEGARETAKQLRTIIESETRVSWIAASTMLIRSSVGQYGSPWFNILELIELRAMDWSSAYRLVRQLGNRAGFDWSAEAITGVLDLSGRRPYLVQLLAARVTDDLNLQGRDHVTGSDVATAVGDLLDEINLTGSYVGFVWHEAQWFGRLMLWELLQSTAGLSLQELSRRVRQQVDSGRAPLSSSLFDKKFDERFSWLAGVADALEYRSSSPGNSRNTVIGFSIPVVRRWLKQLLDHETNFRQQALEGFAEELQP